MWFTRSRLVGQERARFSQAREFARVVRDVDRGSELLDQPKTPVRVAAAGPLSGCPNASNTAD